MDLIEGLGMYHRKIYVCLPDNVMVTQLIYFHGTPGDVKNMTEKLWESLEQACGKADMGLVMLEVEDWNRDMSPWRAERLFTKGDDFAGQGEEYLMDLCHQVIPKLESRYVGRILAERRIIGGYSMGGLFALYAMMESPVFTDMISVSGSLWYDGIIDYVKEKVSGAMEITRSQNRYAQGHRIFDLPVSAYFSLGQREPKVRNARMKRVWKQTAAICDMMEEWGIPVYFQWNQGNHFQDELARIERGIRFMTDRKRGLENEHRDITGGR